MTKALESNKHETTLTHIFKNSSVSDASFKNYLFLLFFSLKVL